MDLSTLLSSFVLSLGAQGFIVHETIPLEPAALEIDIETFGLNENKRFIILVDHGKVVQQVRVPLADQECKNPN